MKSDEKVFSGVGGGDVNDMLWERASLCYEEHVQ